MAQAVTAAGRDDMLPVLTGVRVELDGDSIAMLATDRFRLSQRELTWSPTASDIDAAALVPAKVLADTAKALVGGSEISIALSNAGRAVARARGSSASRARPAAAFVVRRPDCSTATSPRCARCSRAST